MKIVLHIGLIILVVVVGDEETRRDLTRDNTLLSQATSTRSREFQVSTTTRVILMFNLKTTVNSMVSQFSILTKEVIRVSVEVGTDGKLGVHVVVADVQVF